jgi:hypothetical protein
MTEANGEIPEGVPDEGSPGYIRATVTLDKEQILAALRDGELDPGAWVEFPQDANRTADGCPTCATGAVLRCAVRAIKGSVSRMEVHRSGMLISRRGRVTGSDLTGEELDTEIRKALVDSDYLRALSLVYEDPDTSGDLVTTLTFVKEEFPETLEIEVLVLPPTPEEA